MAIAFFATIKSQTIFKSINLRHLLLMLGSAAVICILFYSSFFQNFQGVPDAFISYKEYFLSASGKEIHHHPWYYYLGLLVYFKNGSFPFWSEGFTLILAIIGIFLLIRKHTSAFGDTNILRFISIYTISLIVFFSLIPYKTPWNLLGFLPGLVILSAFAILELSRICPKKYIRYIYYGLIMVGLTHLLWESVILNFKYYSSQANPYVYAHPGNDVFYIQEQIDQIIKTHPEGNNIHIQVIAPGDDYWPLPWYFRSFHRIGWWNHVPMDEPAAPVIIVAADLEPDLIQKLYERPPPGKRDLYLPIFDRYTELRPGIEFRGYIKKGDWDLMQRTEY
jgi:predicted membrane-bound mannosyltransferase